MDEIQKRLLKEVADLDALPVGAYNIRADGQAAGRRSTANIEIVPQKERQGIEIHVKDGTVNESMHIPVIMEQSGLKDLVYNDFYIGDDCDVDIIAGCGIHNCGGEEARHDGVHTFYIGKNSVVRYVERHYGDGDGNGARVMNPDTIAYIGEGSVMQLDTTQIRGVDSTVRRTSADVGKNASVIINEKLMTHGSQHAESDMTVTLSGENSTGKVTSRSVARDSSVQEFRPIVIGANKCFGHVRCDSILMDSAQITSSPAIEAKHTSASLTHEAAIGRIAGEQLIKLMTLGLTEEEAEEQILEGFLDM